MFFVVGTVNNANLFVNLGKLEPIIVRRSHGNIYILGSEVSVPNYIFLPHFTKCSF